jgi:transcriptional regulator with XRE-family HTH domain
MEQHEQAEGAKPDAQLISSQELSDMVKLLRGGRNWSQEQLAEISGLTARTIQRVERGETSNFDTRRALARAFEAPDIDCFNNPFVRITPEKAEAMTEKFRKDHFFLPAALGTGSALLELAEIAEGDMFHSATQMSQPAEELFAALTDYWREYRDAHDCYNAVSKLEVRKDLQGYLDELDREGFSVRVADRPVAVGLGGVDESPYRTRVAYIVAFAKGKEPIEIIVAKAENVQFT